MKIHISGRGVGVGAPLRRRVELKVAKMDRLLPKITEARVVLGLERYRHLAEVTLQTKGATLHAEGSAGDFQAALDLAVDNLAQQVRRRKDRIRARKPRLSRRPPAAGVAGELAAEPPPASGDATGDAEVVIRRLDAKPMSVDEAIEQMRLRRDGLLVFLNARSRVVNVLHRRSDGQLELVQPTGA
ncbi:MAG TPA: ribosome-associated translation inhibitor RaiA [Methylomirabilota bacterium]|jgi:putative sigma-54 modulation protein|nr:ribosome-associated translation inhibitor RaiA [Methylomirabilota bacterium]